MAEKIASIVMPVFNEEKYVADCVESLLSQDYPQESMEWIFVDGASTDATKKILAEYQAKYPDLIKICDNPNKTVPYAMNIGIKESVGKYVVRLDAHAEYARDYISKCVRYLDTTDALNVGGAATTKSKSESGRTIALMLSSKFGVGNSRFRTDGKSGEVDTVPFGAFRRSVFSDFGGFDERLTRNQDNEINYRIRKNGGKVYLANDIRLTYYCRDTVKGVAKMARLNGKWNVIAMKLCPGSMGVRHFAPLLFVLSILALSLGGLFWTPLWLLLAAEAAAYLTLDVAFSLANLQKARDFFRLLYLFPVFHISYGVGSLVGLLELSTKKFRTDYEPPKI